MWTRTSPALRKERLSRELRSLHDQSGLTAATVAKTLSWSPSKVTRALRDDWELPNAGDVTALLDAYGVDCPTDRDRLLALVPQARQRGWWETYDLPAGYVDYISMEHEARVIRNVEPLVVPGLLQTPEYARALLNTRTPALPPEVVAERVQARLARQQHVLASADPVRLWAVLDEAVLHRQVGDPDVMRAQLEHLLKAMEHPAVTLLVLPFTANATTGTGPFSILTFGEPADPEIVYEETRRGGHWVRECDTVSEYKLMFEQLVIAAAKRDETRQMIGGFL